MSQKCVSGRCSAPDPAGGAYSAPKDPLAGFERAASPAYGYKSAGLLSFSSPYMSFVWSLKVLEFDFDFDKCARNLYRGLIV